MYKPEISADSTLKDTLHLLQEVSAYLKRLPHVPITAELVRKVDAHLQSPETISSLRLAHEHEKMETARCATVLSSLGMPLIEFEVYPHSLKVQITPVRHFQASAIDQLFAKQSLELPLVPALEHLKLFSRKRTATD